VVRKGQFQYFFSKPRLEWSRDGKSVIDICSRLSKPMPALVASSCVLSVIASWSVFVPDTRLAYMVGACLHSCKNGSIPPNIVIVAVE